MEDVYSSKRMEATFHWVDTTSFGHSDFVHQPFGMERFASSNTSPPNVLRANQPRHNMTTVATPPQCANSDALQPPCMEAMAARDGFGYQ